MPLKCNLKSEEEFGVSIISSASFQPNAKINLGLNVTEKRADGFHNIETIFYPIGWNDALEIIVT